MTKKERVATERMERELGRLREEHRQLTLAVWALLDLLQEVEISQAQGEAPAAALLAELASVGQHWRALLAEGGKGEGKR